MIMEIGVVCNRPADWDWLTKLREWVREKLDKRLPKPRVISVSRIAEALRWRNELADDRLVVAVGFRREEIDRGRIDFGGPREPVILFERGVEKPNGHATASFADYQAIVACSDPIPFVKKSLIRSWWRGQVEIRSPASPEEWEGYFSLRYRIWKECNFLRDENKRARTKWEIDWKDRMAIPLCAITPEGKVVGCARVLKPYGDEEQTYVSKITNLLGEIGDEALLKLFSFPNCQKHPFDLLMEFPGFRAHFAELIRNNKEAAEISRVAIDPEYRGRSLTEALVDTAVSLAEVRHFTTIFLACQERHAGLYSKCGFVPVEGIKSDKYLHIQLPSIIMERPLC
jgi:predicted GNAT family N-acyltransferase